MGMAGSLARAGETHRVHNQGFNSSTNTYFSLLVLNLLIYQVNKTKFFYHPSYQTQMIYVLRQYVVFAYCHHSLTYSPFLGLVGAESRFVVFNDFNDFFLTPLCYSCYLWNGKTFFIHS
jgi:hypothetical protein